MKTRWISIVVCLLILLVHQQVGFSDGAVRTPSAKEINQLFDLAIWRPRQLRLRADITNREAAWSVTDIAKQIKAQNEAMKDTDSRKSDKLQNASQVIRSNTIAQYHSGVIIQHIQEWYSGSKYRLDQSQSTSGVFATNSQSDFYHDTFVNIGDPNFSPYNSFSVNHEIRDALLSKDPSRNYAPKELWRILGLDDAVAVPIILALIDVRSMSNNQSTDLSDGKIDLVKVASLRDGTDKNWRLQASDVEIDGISAVRFTLDGRIFEVEDAQNTEGEPAMTPIQAVYWIASKAGRIVCLQSIYTNHVFHNAVIASRSDLDGQGYPRVFSSATYRKGALVKRIEGKVSAFDLAGFDEKSVFLPEFPPNYSVGDITSGRAIILKNPRPTAKIQEGEPGQYRKPRTLILLLLAVVSLPLLVAAYRLHRSQAKTGK